MDLLISIWQGLWNGFTFLKLLYLRW